MKKLIETAVFGGTFDPPTRAHELIIEYALQQPEIDEVWVMPSGQRIDKPYMLDNATRMEMLEFMKQQNFADNNKLVLADFEMHLPQPSHTSATARALRQKFPNRRFHFIFGVDSFDTMHTWEDGQELKSTLDMLIVPRNGDKLPAESGNIRILPVPKVDEMGISSTQARQALAAGRPVDQFVSRAVAQFLANRHCYQPV